MKLIELMSSKEFIGCLGTFAGLIALVKKSWREGIINLFSFKKDKAEIQKDTIITTNESLEFLQKRVNSMHAEFIKLSDINLVTQKENYELKSKVNSLESKLLEQARIIGGQKIKISHLTTQIKDLNETINKNFRK